MCQAVPTENLALSWYILTTALQFTIRTIEYLFLNLLLVPQIPTVPGVYYWSHRSLLCQEVPTENLAFSWYTNQLLVPQLIVPVGTNQRPHVFLVYSKHCEYINILQFIILEQILKGLSFPNIYKHTLISKGTPLRKSC